MEESVSGNDVPSWQNRKQGMTKKTIIQIEIDTPLVGEQLEESKYEIIVSDPNENTFDGCECMDTCECDRPSRIVGYLHKGSGIKIVSVEP